MTGDKAAVQPPDLLPRVFRAQKLQSIGRLAGGIAHDFNNLLGGALTAVDLLLDDAAASPATRRELRRIQATLVRGAGIVRELMLYTDEAAGGSELVDLVCLAETMLDLLRVSMSKAARLKVSFDRNLPAVRANPAQIRHLILNLIVNASEALQGGEGEITLTISGARPEGVRLVVADTGPGMPEQVRERIFSPSFSTKAPGRGLGLFLVHEIVRVHGGSIGVTSAPGKGSSFEIMLPGASGRCDGVERDTAPQTVTPKQHSRSTVLMVEDEESLRSAIAGLLTRRGFTVIQAGDGSTGIEQFRAHEREIETVLLDVTLPGVTSREVLRHIRSARPDMHVILTSAYAYETAVANLEDQRPWEFVKKPYRVQELVAVLSGITD